MCSIIFFFNDTATTEIYTLSLHDALPIFERFLELLLELLLLLLDDRVHGQRGAELGLVRDQRRHAREAGTDDGDRKSTRLNSSHANISYAVFCLKKKNNTLHPPYHVPTHL